MQKRMKLFLSAVLLIIMILSMVTPAFATETEDATAPTTEHIHNWQLLGDTRNTHILTCTTCSQTQYEPHTSNGNGEEICIVCGRYFHAHKWQRIKADIQFHTIVCTSCGESQTATHSMREDVCTVCGYETHTHVMQYVGGEVYASEHETKCTFCDSTGIEPHTYGSDDKCTVCGAKRPCEHQWKSNGEQYLGNHVLACACGQTTTEPHSWTWNATGNYVVCTVCSLIDSGHWHLYFYPGGTHCIECGYYRGTVGSGTQPNGTEPAETEPTKTEPVETEPTETEPIETEPTATNPAEATSGEANPAETEPEASDTIDEEDKEVDSLSGGSTIVWVVAVVSIAAGLTTILFLRKKKSS